MIKALEIFQRDQERLLNELQKAPTPMAAVEVAQHYVQTIGDFKGEYISELTRSQAKIALSIISTYGLQQKLLANLEAISHIEICAEPAIPPSARRSPVGRTLTSIASSSTATWTVASGAAGAAGPAAPWVAMALGAAVGVIADRVFSREDTLQNGEASSSASHGHAESCPRPDYSVLLSGLEALFTVVDDVTEEYERLVQAARPRRTVPTIEDHPSVLGYAQDLLGWYSRNRANIPEPIQNALDARIGEGLPDLLSEYSVEVRFYDSACNRNENAAIFDFEPEVGEVRLAAPVTPVTVLPALVRNETALLRGRVIEPRPHSFSTSHSFVGTLP